MNVLRVRYASLHQHDSRKLGIFCAEIINRSFRRAEFSGGLREPPRDFELRQLDCAVSVEFTETRQDFKAQYHVRIGAEARDLRTRAGHIEIGRASCRERVESWVGGGALTKKRQEST